MSLDRKGALDFPKEDTVTQSNAGVLTLQTFNTRYLAVHEGEN